ncbi:two-component system sensor histidine kinase NtrB [Lysobacter enzymogenes]|uniref:two-component system sensor histidine kinase NtrB n=1 Tax=Lysobacter enzymogenes TaxID=69 RepID=UPI000898C538|nr:ATP-binding protein [Lysobacter enzymogenes]SDX93254.1 two-component system, NtrC family, nitrogen regulation sensor histidine kinase GlnL [Lysobacter enzymogenes]
MPPDPALSADLSLDALTTPVAWSDAAGALTGCNLAFSRWFGVGARRLLGWPLAGLDAGDGRLALAVARAGGDEAPLRMRRMRLRYGDGEERFADLWLSRRDDGGWLLEAHPVDEFPGDDPALLLPSALSASLKGLAHELRNPLAGLKGAAQLLARRVDDADSRELVELIDSEVGRLAGLVDRLLTPAPPRPHAPLNIHAVLERVLRLAEADAGWAVRLVRDYDPSLPEFAGDADRLMQAVWNLARNAIEAGANHVHLRTRVEHGARIGDSAHPIALRLEIIDDGRGVPEELAEQLFLPLVSGRAEGSGLGLALAQQVAREHRGSLTYRSRPGHTVFTLLLPMQIDGHAPQGESMGAQA